jgi:hypothetical protein
MARYKPRELRRDRATPLGWQQPPSNPDVADVVRLLESVRGKRYDGHEQAWDRVLALLNLSLDYQPAVAMVLEQGRWRDKDDPQAYVATSAFRQARGLELPDFGDQHLGVRVGPGGGPPAAVDSRFFKRMPDGNEVDLIGTAEWGFADIDVLSWRDTVPEWLWVEDTRSHVDWQKVAAIAVPKPAMRPYVVKALRLRFDDHIGATEGVRRQRQAGKKAALAAAFKWVARNQDRLSAVATAPTEQEARRRLYGPPKVPTPIRPARITAEEALAAVIARGKARCFPTDSGPGLLIDWCRYGF